MPEEYAAFASVYLQGIRGEGWLSERCGYRRLSPLHELAPASFSINHAFNFMRAL